MKYAWVNMIARICIRKNVDSKSVHLISSIDRKILSEKKKSLTIISHLKGMTVETIHALSLSIPVSSLLK